MLNFSIADYRRVLDKIDLERSRKYVVRFFRNIVLDA